MNKTIELLKQASELEKESYTNYVTSFTSSGISTLVKGGIAFEKAANFIKEACEKDSKLNSIKANIMAFEKAAEYIEDQDIRISELEKIASEVKEVQATSEDSPLNKLAAIGFSKEEIELMSDLPENLLTKVASSNSQPWEMGGGVGLQREKTDPLLEFIIG